MTTPINTPLPTKVVDNTPAPFEFNKTLIDNKLATIKKFYETFVGKPGFNSYLYLKDVVQPLVNRLDSGERTQKLFVEILALEQAEPKINVVRQDNFPTHTVSANFGEDIAGNAPKETVAVTIQK